MSIRYYLYISDSKIDMMLPQIAPKFARKRSSEVGIDLKLAVAKRTTEVAGGSDSAARLHRVLQYLSDHGELGPVDRPGKFFGGVLPMRWGPFPGDPSGALVYFTGSTESTVVGLGGSSLHVMGAPPPSLDQRWPGSQTPAMLAALSTDPQIKVLLEAVDGSPESADRGALLAVRQAHEVFPGPAQNLEFVAKRLVHGTVPATEDASETTVLLGSPLYVALVD